MIIAIALSAALCAGVAVVQEESILHVAPGGSDQWSGKAAVPDASNADGPLASLAGARDAVRRLRAEGFDGPIRVEFAEGVYPLNGPVKFAPVDSGRPDGRTTYAAAAGARPVFHGGRRVGNWTVQANGRWVATLPDARDGGWNFEQLWVNGIRATRARTPNTFFQYAEARVEQGVDPATGQVADLSSRAFRFRTGDLRAMERPHDVIIVAYHAWEASRHRVSAVDEASRTVVLANEAPWPMFNWDGVQRYHVENLPEALDAAGEWYLDPDGTLTYIPRPGEHPDQVEVVAPATDAFLVMEGQPEANRFVEHLDFNGLSFQFGQFVTPPDGMSNGQAAVRVPAAVTLDGARDVHFDRCEVAHVGGYGVHARRGCSDVSFRNGKIHDLGAGGFRIGETELRENQSEQTHHIVLDNTIVNGGGRLFPGAVAVWIGQSGDNQVTHNDIGDHYYTGVSVGWTWGYGPSLAVRNRVEFNRIHHLGWNLLSDMGGVYTLGISPGTSVSHNWLHDISAYSYGGWGLYNDEGSTGIVLRNNLVERTKTGSYHQHYGRENLIENNILAYSRLHQLQRTRAEDHLSFTLRRNIILWSDAPLLDGKWLDANVALDHNLYWDESGAPVSFAGRSFAEWQSMGKDAGSIIAEPGFSNPRDGDFTLAPSSPARALGFVPFDWTRAGLRAAENPWSDGHLRRPYPDMITPPAPPSDVREDFETTATGRAPSSGVLSLEGKGDRIVIEADGETSSNQILTFQDRSGLDHSYNPHWVLQPRVSTGRARLAFDFQLHPGAVLYHEWRDSRSPYRIGPSIRIADGELRTADGSTVKGITPGVWYRIVIEADLAPSSTRRWSLMVGPREGPPLLRRDDLPLVHDDWNALDWLGFVSDADSDTQFSIDNLDFEPLANR